MTHRRLVIGVPLATLCIALIAIAIVLFVAPRPVALPLRLSVAIALAVVSAGALALALQRSLARLQAELGREAKELLALHAAAEGVHRVMNLEELLQRIVDQARELVGARYGALSVVGEDGSITAFHTSGLSPEQRQRLGDPPRGHGLLGVVLYKGQVLRLPEIARDPRSVGFPPHHPPMRSLLAVPVDCRGPFRGNLYLTDKEGEREFSEHDVETLRKFASPAAIAIDNQFVHRRLRELAVAEERAQIARDLHDSTAQILAYVNTKAQAVREYSLAGRHADAHAHLDQLATAARGALTDLRDGIQGLRAAVESGRSLSESMRAVLTVWQDQAQIHADFAGDEGLRLDPERELQLVRILQEALANVRKHSRASRVRVELRHEQEALRLLVEDDGVGFDPQAPPLGDLRGFGLATMHERAEGAGGWLTIESSPGQPTRVKAVIPWRRGPTTPPAPSPPPQRADSNS